jgi:NOL1/NOP2/sun family putative RNA methylase
MNEFQEYFKTLIGEDEAEQFFSSLAVRSRRSLRVNTLRTNKAELTKWLNRQGYEVFDSKFSPEGIEISGEGQPLALKLPYHAGFTYPQDSASMFAVELLDPQPGESIVDLTSAPGGKTTHIAQKMQNTGFLLANDMDTRRLKAVHSNLERLGVFNTVVSRLDPYKLAQWYGEFFDRVLLDPSCSGEGLMASLPGKKIPWNLKSVKRYSKDQYRLICNAFQMLKPGGRLVYSTCTLNGVEDDEVVEKLLEKYPQAKIESIAHPGTPEQIGNLKGVRFWPHKTGTKGFFCIAITKTESLGLLPTSDRKMHTLQALRPKALQAHRQYTLDHFGVHLPDLPAILRDEHLFFMSEELSKTEIPAFHSLAFPMLKVYSHEFRPTHAGALWLGLQAKNHVYELSREELERMFERQPIPNSSGQEGLFLAKYEGFPLGIAKLTARGVEVVVPRQY